MWSLNEKHSDQLFKYLWLQNCSNYSSDISPEGLAAKSSVVSRNVIQIADFSTRICDITNQYSDTPDLIPTTNTVSHTFILYSQTPPI